MSCVVYRMVQSLSSLVASLPVGTNLAVLHLLWMLVGGRLLESRGAVTPGLAALELPAPAVRRAVAALAYGRWEIAPLLQRWEQQVVSVGVWQPREHGGYRPVACDLIGFYRPRLRDCPTKHYLSSAGKALPAIPLGIVGRVGRVGEQRLALPVCLVRADPADPRETRLQERLLKEGATVLGERDVLVCDAGFPLAQVLAAGVCRFVVRVPKNFTARRASLPPGQKTGRPREYGEVVRPLARRYKEKEIPATPPDRQETWHHEGRILRADSFENLVLIDAKPGATTFGVIVIHDPEYPEPLVLVVHEPMSGPVAAALYDDRWAVEQPPLVSKQLLGAHRQFVFGAESRQRLPELALLSGSILTYLAATSPPIPTGFWDRKPRATAGRLRRVLARTTFPESAELPERIRRKSSPTAHLPKGVDGHRRRQRGTQETPPLRLAA